MDKIKLRILGISYSQSQSGAYALILVESNGSRRLPIIIGSFEAQSIAIELEKMKPTRPLTHDLFKSFADTFNIVIREIVINKFSDGIFYAQLVCWDGEKIIEIDSRTSDAVAIALRAKCNIYTYESILRAAGVEMSEDNGNFNPPEMPEEKYEDTQPEKISEYSSMSLKQLEELLKTAIENELYEKASFIRDEITKRKKKK